jgi:hypothetical protein
LLNKILSVLEISRIAELVRLVEPLLSLVPNQLVEPLLSLLPNQLPRLEPLLNQLPILELVCGIIREPVRGIVTRAPVDEIVRARGMLAIVPVL